MNTLLEKLTTPCVLSNALSIRPADYIYFALLGLSVSQWASAHRLKVTNKIALEFHAVLEPLRSKLIAAIEQQARSRGPKSEPLQ